MLFDFFLVFSSHKHFIRHFISFSVFFTPLFDELRKRRRKRKLGLAERRIRKNFDFFSASINFVASLCVVDPFHLMAKKIYKTKPMCPIDWFVKKNWSPKKKNDIFFNLIIFYWLNQEFVHLTEGKYLKIFYFFSLFENASRLYDASNV